MAKITIKSEEPIKDALRRFKKMCDKEGIINHAKRLSYYEKPSERRRREEAERLKSIRRAQKSSYSRKK